MPKPEHFLLPPHDWVPNNPRLPVLLYRQVLPSAPAEDLASEFEEMFRRNGWPPRWRAGVYDYHHYHSTAHEVLGFAGGAARLMLGGLSSQRADTTKEQVKVYRRRCQIMSAANAVGLISAMPLILTLICGGLDVLFPVVPLVNTVGAIGALFGLVLLIIAALCVLAEGAMAHRQIDTEIADMPDRAKATGKKLDTIS